jgi:hypothetical protein
VTLLLLQLLLAIATEASMMATVPLTAISMSKINKVQKALTLFRGSGTTLRRALFEL